MKIAFVALPRPEDVHVNRIAPPLPLGYVAAMLEQRRHIVRVYDLALPHDRSLASALAPLRLFRPHLIVLASDDPTSADRVLAALDGYQAPTLRIGTSLREVAPGRAVARALMYGEDNGAGMNEQSVIFEALLALDDDLDSLPFPARHLLPLEQYPLVTLDGELQTTVMIAQQITPSYIIARRPSQIAAEVQNVMREYGIRHFVFAGPPLSHDTEWLDVLLEQFSANETGMRWEGGVQMEALTAEMAQQLRQAGCETLFFDFAAGDVLVAREGRAALARAAQLAHDAGIGVRANILLDPPYNALPSLIDVSATLGLDAVHFNVQPAADLALEHPAGGISLEEVAEMARTRYRSSRSRQFFVTRFGPQLGPMLWRVGRAGLLGRTWQHYADGGEEKALAY